ncbi:MAG: hypothetical protein DMD43_09470 [Gemmatimonadetes bacterium]|nr:MAG: hypothetical protein DMD43_09470 [Gemmatimonadota bacterium]
MAARAAAKNASGGSRLYTLMNSAPPPASESTARLASSAVATATDPGQMGGRPSRMWPEPTIRGPTSSPLLTRDFADFIQSSRLNISRTPVIPLATSSGRKCASSPGIAAWTCMSQRPGLRYLPEASITRAPRGAVTPASAPSAVMRPFSTTTVMPGTARPCSTSMTVAWTKAIGGETCAGAD